MTQFEPKQVPPAIAPQPDPAPHKPAEDDTDETYFEGSPQLRGQIGNVLRYGFFGIVVIAAPICLELVIKNRHLPVLAYLIPALIGVALFFVPMLSVKSVSYKITNYRINVTRGILSKTIDTIELWHVEEPEFHQSMLDRLLNVGSIRIYSHNPKVPNLTLRSIPNAGQVFERLQQRIIAVKRQRGVVKMDLGN